MRRIAAGALASFCGLVRKTEGGRPITALHIEHYPGMTERCLQRIAEGAAQRWPLTGVLVVHRVGRVRVGKPIVLVACASAHRQDAIAACANIMDYLKTRAPFWKRASGPDGALWVVARAQDEAEAERWRT